MDKLVEDIIAGAERMAEGVLGQAGVISLDIGNVNEMLIGINRYKKLKKKQEMNGEERSI